MIKRDLFRLRTFNTEHPDDFAVGRHTVRAEIAGRTDKENVFLLSAGQSSFLHQNCRDQSGLRINQIRPESLCAEEVRNETECRFNLEERRKLAFVGRRSANVAHYASEDSGSCHAEDERLQARQGATRAGFLRLQSSNVGAQKYFYINKNGSSIGTVKGGPPWIFVEGLIGQAS